MIVVDASALLELLLGTPTGRVVGQRIAAPELGLHVPHLVDLEIAQALRRYLREGEIDPARAASALQALRDLDVERHAGHRGGDQGTPRRRPMHEYLNEFVFRFNRRRSRRRGMVFHRVLERAVRHAPVRYADITAGHWPRKTPPTPLASRGTPASLEIARRDPRRRLAGAARPGDRPGARAG